ncbi:lysozyme inhibitor LprI family protein [Phenylobacterium terrae]|uniref:Lysozyme inhibitor LprI family protein n=1 Tax=Phenylobacterium terrae TaxID=2665495 RepID=A0ABW4N072_9CAUL
MTKRTIVAGFVGLAAAALALAAAGADWSDDAEWADSYPESRAICRDVRDRTVPAADRPTAAEAAQLKGCDSEALYYGIGRPADPVAARKCAILELEGTAASDAGYFAGRTILATVYANGVGAGRDTRLAIRLACQDEDSAPAEVDGRVRDLAGSSPPESFHWCDHVTSGRMMGVCAAHFARIDGAKREAEIATLTAAWSPPERKAFAALRTAADAFIAARAENEVDMSGTMRAALSLGEEERQRDAFKALLTELEAGKAPSGGLAPADAELNRVYRQVMNAGEDTRLDWGTVAPDDIRATQRIWLRYRDAWLAFAKVKYPQVSPDALAARLTQERTAMLRGFLEEAS